MGIKFRIWDKIHKKMITDICRLHFSNGVLYGVLTWESELLFSDNFESMQFIGINDKNNKEIFAGDRVSIWYEELFFKGTITGEIEWDDNTAQFVIMFPDDGVSIPIASIDLNFSEIEVVGNIYDCKECHES